MKLIEYLDIVTDDYYTLLSLGNGQFTDDLTESRERGGTVHRKELDNQPMVDGYLSPMWDGGKLRYETQEVYDKLSR